LQTFTPLAHSSTETLIHPADLASHDTQRDTTAEVSGRALPTARRALIVSK